MKVEVLASGSSGNCYKIKCGDTALLIECGISYKKILGFLDFSLKDIDGCLLSHEHKDHSWSVKDILKRGINLFCTEGTAKALKLKHHRLELIKAKKQFRIKEFTILPFELEHDAAEPVGFLLRHDNGKQLLFITDSFFCKYRFDNVNIMLVECNYIKSILDERVLEKKLLHRIRTSHMELDTLLEFLSKCDLTETEKIYLIHLSDNNSDEKKMKEEVQKLTGKEVIVC